MGILSRFRAERAGSRLSDEALYAQALREVESGIRRDGLWAKALAEAGMRQTDAQALYLQLRVQSLRDECELRSHHDAESALRHRQMLAARQANERDTRAIALEAKRNRPPNGLRDWLNVLLGLVVVMSGIVLLLALFGK